MLFQALQRRGNHGFQAVDPLKQESHRGISHTSRRTNHGFQAVDPLKLGHLHVPSITAAGHNHGFHAVDPLKHLLHRLIHRPSSDPTTTACSRGPIEADNTAGCSRNADGQNHGLGRGPIEACDRRSRDLSHTQHNHGFQAVDPLKLDTLQPAPIDVQHTPRLSGRGPIEAGSTPAPRPTSPGITTAFRPWTH